MIDVNTVNTMFSDVPMMFLHSELGEFLKLLFS